MTTSAVPTPRVIHKFSPEEERRYQSLRAQIAQELPDLVARGRLADEAAVEKTVSGALRRAIHLSPLTIDELGKLAAIDGTWIDEFLTGERTLRSDVLDRLAAALGFDFPLAPGESAASAISAAVAEESRQPNTSNASAMLIWTAWNNGSHLPSGAGYGLKVPIVDRDAHFDRAWTSVTLELLGPATTSEVELNIAKPSFWNETCHELISQEIGRWLRSTGLAPWPPGQPPKINVEVVGERRFRVTGSVR